MGAVRHDGEREHLLVREALRELGRAGVESSAQTITVGPEPERVAPAAPAGGLARTSSRIREGR